MSNRKGSRNKLFAKITHTATSGVIGETEYQVHGENALRVATTFTASGTLTVQGRIEHSDAWDNLGTLTSGVDTDEIDIGSYDYVRFNFTVAAGSSGEIAASGFFKGSSGSAGATTAFTIMQTDAGTSPVADSVTDTLTFTSSDASATITGNSTTDTIDIVVPAIPTVYSNPNVAYTGSESFGDSSVSTSTYTTAIGNTSTASGTNSTAIGNAATASGVSTTAIGKSSVANGSYGIAIGMQATTNGGNSLVIGYQATARSASSITIGSTVQPLKNMFLGEGEQQISATLGDVSIRPTKPIAITNAVGGDLLLLGAGSTGNLAGSSVKLQTQTAVSASGSTGNNTWTDQLEVTGLGEVVLNAEDAATADATLWNNSISFYLDETGNTLTVKAKYAAGTVKTGTIALT